MNNAATPTKLRNGAWGARVQGSVSEGDTITITARSGKSWQATVEKVVWTGGGVSICATASLDRPTSGLAAAVGGAAARRSMRYARRGNRGECTCGACDDLLSFGYQPGQRVRCKECGGWAEAC